MTKEEDILSTIQNPRRLVVPCLALFVLSATIATLSPHPPSSPPHTHFRLMSHSHLADSSSSRFQLIISNALKAYEKRTQKDLLAHPLAVQLQACNTPADILAILQQQVQGLDQSQSSNDRWTKWLDPTVSVLYNLSETLGEGVALVSLGT